MRKMLSLACLGILSFSGCVVHERDRYERDYDPVCGVEVTRESPWHEEFEGRVYYFHDRECRDRFRERPHAYAGERERYRREAR